MRNYKIGDIIKKKRIELGITQEQLCEGICEPSTLSKIENNRQAPTRTRFNAIMERLGLSQDFFYAVIDEDEYELYELKYKIIQCNIKRKDAEALELLRKFESLVQEDDNLNKQFILRSKAVMATYLKLKNVEILNMLNEAMSMTHTDFDVHNLQNYVLSFEESKIIVNIALIKYAIGEKVEAFQIFYNLLGYIDHRFIDEDERGRIFPLLTYNLSKCLGKEGRHEEAIEIADKGIECCRENERYNLIAELTLNKACSYCEIGRKEESLSLLKQTYYTMLIMNRKKFANVVKNYVKKTFGLNLDS